MLTRTNADFIHYCLHAHDPPPALVQRTASLDNCGGIEPEAVNTLRAARAFGHTAVERLGREPAFPAEAIGSTTVPASQLLH